ncbi:MAG: ABC transporter permease [Imperialibacter sp.]|uniref:ABC transporter permease n=1 Tax=Imperialibacter sp. TaxID=2038411 RepID=UPI003A8A024C
MLTSYLKIAFRSLLRHKTTSAITIFGLGLALAAALLIGQYVRFELSYDRFHGAGTDRTYRIFSRDFSSGALQYEAATSPAVLATSLLSTTQVEAITRLCGSSSFSNVLSYDNGEEVRSFNTSHTYFAETSFFDFFDFPLIKGSKEALDQPFQVIISESMALKFFGADDPMGKTLKRHTSTDDVEYTVAGVLKDLPANTHMAVNFLFSFPTLAQTERGRADLKDWDAEYFHSYVRLREGSQPEDLSEQLMEFEGEWLGKYGMAPDPAHPRWHMQPVVDIHLHSQLMEEMKTNNSAADVYFLVAIALFVLVIAWVNHINLSMFSALSRGKEVGVRRLIGAGKWQLIQQFVAEAFAVNLLALTVAFTVVQVSSGWFQAIAGSPFGLFWKDDTMLAVCALLFVVSGAISSLVPFFLLQNKQLASMLKGKMSNVAGGGLRSALMVVQFAASLFIIVGTAAVYGQLKFMHNMKLGIDIENTLVLTTPSLVDSTYLSQLDVFKNELQQYPGIRSVSTSAFLPGSENAWQQRFWKPESGSDEAVLMTFNVVDDSFVDVFGVEIVEGRDFLPTEQRAGDFGDALESILINEKAVQAHGFASTREAVGSELASKGVRCKIVGVVKDFHQESPKAAIPPAMFVLDNINSTFYAVKLNFPVSDLNSESLTAALAFIEGKWEEVFPNNPFDYFLLENRYEQQYASEDRLSTLLGVFSGLSIFISCLGLFGLVSLTIAQRTKEIGIRKVLGASVADLLLLLSSRFVRLVALAVIVTLPITFWLVNEWLQNYAYAMRLGWWLFALPGAGLILLALAVVVVEALPRTQANPVDSLRME